MSFKFAGMQVTRAISASKFPGPLNLHEVYRPRTGLPSVDIIFVHGLGGGSLKTWCYNKDPTVFWPKWLPDKGLPQARITTFGYDAQVRGPLSGLPLISSAAPEMVNIDKFAGTLLQELETYIDDGGPDWKYGNFPIIFICHSMGGLVVKRAVVKAACNPKLSVLNNSITGMIFLGTPHRGSSQANILNAVSNITGKACEYLADLTLDSAMLRMINDDFKHQVERIHLHSFYEQYKTPVSPIGLLKLMIVEEMSATLGFSEEGVSALPADHHNICKYASVDDPNFRVVMNVIKAMVEKVVSGSPTRLKGAELPPPAYSRISTITQ